MKQLIILLSLTLLCFTAKSSTSNLPITDDKGKAQILEIILKDYKQSLQYQQSTLKAIIKSKSYKASIKKRAKQVLPTVTGAIRTLTSYKERYNFEKMKDGELRKVGRELLQNAHSSMQEADGVIVIIIDGGGGGDGDDGGDEKPDCSGAFNNIQSACAGGVSMKMQCGYFNNNGGAAAVEQALEKCTMDANAAVASCESGSNTNTYGQESAYESNAMLVCSQFEGDGLEPNAAQTQTSTGN